MSKRSWTGNDGLLGCRTCFETVKNTEGMKAIGDDPRALFPNRPLPDREAICLHGAQMELNSASPLNSAKLTNAEAVRRLNFDTPEQCSKTFDLSQTMIRIDTSVISSTECCTGHFQVFKS